MFWVCAFLIYLEGAVQQNAVKFLQRGSVLPEQRSGQDHHVSQHTIAKMFEISPSQNNMRLCRNLQGVRTKSSTDTDAFYQGFHCRGLGTLWKPTAGFSGPLRWIHAVEKGVTDGPTFQLSSLSKGLFQQDNEDVKRAGVRQAHLKKRPPLKTPDLRAKNFQNNKSLPFLSQFSNSE